ncbi:MEDS domain-containing protein [Micromonospora inositola]|uniref:Anti-anti-sigma regulatory factor (Antagonist of anti-sigma factor) n=1 Tax=Micromonospora inositola TaxID=47865 RepID=A0A1C5K3B1_9ACTN|nr:MEDS domain-containing protein [Micromonospora inositola]SCG76766.1 Anti-anti-sigma regulatory factor (antagonist of anti-sigma factor) [Micromonospora inositola]
MTRIAAPLSAYGHICWAYDDPTVLDSRAMAFLAAGLAAGERVWLAAPSTPGSLTHRLDGLPGLADALGSGAARMVPTDDAYRFDEVVDPETQVRHYAAATADALANGYTGFRVVAEATSLVRTPAQRDAFTRYEHLIDRYMRAHPMSAICAYDRRELGDPAIAELACLHPETNVDVLFRLYAADPDEGAVALTGELDPSNHRLFAAALDRVDPQPVDGRLVVDGTGLRFIDHRCLIHLGDHARRRGVTAVLRTTRPAAARLVELLELSHVRVEVA